MSRLAMSRWFVGSSIMRKLCGTVRIFARQSRVFSPPERAETGLSTASPPKRNEPSMCRSIPSEAPGWTSRSSSITRRLLVERLDAVLGEVGREDVRPERRPRPRVGSRMPVSSFIRVVLPAPFGPTRTTWSPRSRSRSRPL